MAQKVSISESGVTAFRPGEPPERIDTVSLPQVRHGHQPRVIGSREGGIERELIEHRNGTQ